MRAKHAAAKIVDRSGSYLDIIEKTLADKRYVHISGMINTSLSYEVCMRLRGLAAISDDPITVFINSPGGVVSEGFAIYDLMREISKKAPITTVAQGQCMSMGVVILQGGSKRLAMPHTFFLLHELHADRSGTNSLSEMKDDMEYSRSLQNTIDEILTTRTGLELAKLKKLYTRKETFMDAKEAKKNRLIDGIIEL